MQKFHDSNDEPAAKRIRKSLNTTAELPEESVETCFICDTIIVGKKYSLASCMTNGTKIRLVEVLGRLVSDKYMVVVSHEEYICRGCANLLNTLDRLEAEILSVKRIVLNFVERKYNLGDGLKGQLTRVPVTYTSSDSTTSAKDNPSSGAPKTPSTSVTSPSKMPIKMKPPVKSTPLPMVPKIKTPTPAPNSTRTKMFKITLKDEQVLNSPPASSQMLLHSAEEKALGANAPSLQTSSTSRNNVYMQCNQCQYTTNQRSTMLEHLRQHVAARAKPNNQKPTNASPPKAVPSENKEPIIMKSAKKNDANGKQSEPNKTIIQMNAGQSSASKGPCIILTTSSRSGGDGVVSKAGKSQPLMLTIDGKLAPKSSVSSASTLSNVGKGTNVHVDTSPTKDKTKEIVSKPQGKLTSNKMSSVVTVNTPEKSEKISSGAQKTPKASSSTVGKVFSTSADTENIEKETKITADAAA